MNRPKLKSGTLIFLIILGFAALVQVVYQYWKKHQLQSCSKVQTTGIVYKAYLNTYRTSGLWVEYRYKVGEKEYTSDFNLGLDCNENLVSLLPKKHFTILYCSQKPGLSIPLIAPKTFKENKKAVPDSLNWLKVYFPTK